MNIPKSIRKAAKEAGLDEMGTGGGVDYVYKELGTNDDGSRRFAILSHAGDLGSPESLKTPSEIVVTLNENWTTQVVIPVGSASLGISLMEKMTHNKFEK